MVENDSRIYDKQGQALVTMQSDVAAMKEDQQTLQSNIKSSMAIMNVDLQTLKSTMTAMQSDMKLLLSQKSSLKRTSAPALL